MKSWSAVLLFAASVAFASMPAAAEDAVVAKVDGAEIKQSDLDFAASEVGSQLANYPDEDRRAPAAAIRHREPVDGRGRPEGGAGKGSDFEGRLAYHKRRALRDAYYEKTVRGGVSEDEAKKLYEEKIGSVKPEPEIHARHILVDSEDEAKDIKQRLEKGEDFATLAKEKSKDKNADGGDLGFFGKGQMLKPFEDAAFALEVGKISDPFRTPFGWRIIKVEEKRNSAGAEIRGRQRADHGAADAASPRCRLSRGTLRDLRGGNRYANRMDLMLALFEPGTSVAGILTKSKTASAPVEWCRAHLPHGMARALVVNSGNSNAFTGKRGRETVGLTVEAMAQAIGCLTADVYVASTGVIGEPLDTSKITTRLGELVTVASPDACENAARAIMTTDTYPKVATRSAEIGGVKVTINGIAKGAGMIAPDMATLLGFLFTDAAIEPEALHSVLVDSAEDSSTPSPSTATHRRAIRCCYSPPAPPRHAGPRASSRATIRVSPSSAKR